MNVSVDGFRSSSRDWEAAKEIPADQLPALSQEQREVARKLGIPEDVYARSFVAGERNQEALLAKSQRFGLWLRNAIKAVDPDAEVQAVRLRVFQERFEVDISVGSDILSISIPESLVDDYFERGSMEAEQNIQRLASRIVRTRVQ